MSDQKKGSSQSGSRTVFIKNDLPQLRAQVPMPKVKPPQEPASSPSQPSEKK